MLTQPKLSSTGRYFVDQENSPFFYFADTFWYGMSSRASREDFCTIIDDRRSKGVSVIQIVVGFVPETDVQDILTTDAWSSPLTRNLAVNPAYFEEVEWRLSYIVKQGMVPCIVGGWGWHMERLGIEKVTMLWRAILDSIGSLPAFLCLCGEVDLFPVDFSAKESVLAKVKRKIKRHAPVKVSAILRRVYGKVNPKLPEISKVETRLSGWRKVAQFIRAHDSFKRPLTVHVKGFETGNDLFGDPTLFDFDVIQSGHSHGVEEQVREKIEAVSKQGRLILNMEPAYEGILNDFYGEEQVEMFAVCTKAGAKGHAYGANGIWQMSTPDDHFLSHWGDADWKTALSYPGMTLLSKAIAKHLQKKWWV